MPTDPTERVLVPSTRPGRTVRRGRGRRDRHRPRRAVPAGAEPRTRDRRGPGRRTCRLTRVVVHTRGTGASAGGPGPGGWTTDLFAADAVAVLDALGIARAHVHGFSMGGRVAQVLAARFPGRVDRLVLGASGPGGTQEVPCDDDVSRTLRHAARPPVGTALADLFFTPAWSARNPRSRPGSPRRGRPRAAGPPRRQHRSRRLGPPAARRRPHPRRPRR